MRRMVRPEVREEEKKHQISKAGYYLTEDNRYLHRIIYVQYYGPIKRGYVVHHIDGNKLNNEVSNLISMPDWVHAKLHDSYPKNVLPNREKTELFINQYMDHYSDLLTKRRKIKKDISENIKALKSIDAQLITYKRSGKDLKKKIDKSKRFKNKVKVYNTNFK